MMLHAADAAWVASSSSAQPASNESGAAAAVSPDEQAKGHYGAGQAAYNEGDYELAITQFKKSFELTARPELLFNIANCHERLAEYGQAADALARYINDAPIPEQISLRKRVARLRERHQKQMTAGAQSAQENSKLRNQLAQKSTTPPAFMNKRRWSAIALGAFGVAAFAVGVVEFIISSDDVGRAQSQCRDGICAAAARSEFGRASRHQLYGGIAVGLSALSFGGGTYLWLSENETSPQKDNHEIALGLGFRRQF